MPVSFEELVVRELYNRNTLAELWGYASAHALYRGVITPKKDNKIILFVTKKKPIDATQYQDNIEGAVLCWEGESPHGSDKRIANAQENADRRRTLLEKEML
ncbi:MAG: hypothetical protein CL920_03835 [Deltaproteobacteria bacterium]|nr:hypothetical protein [Deltaproteobacteria bacterium]|tara:strand:+ start:5748 stop:6053 length:306 start_codon:yes stop_codon:yes gene_type:complete